MRWNEIPVPFCITVPQIMCAEDHSSSCAGHSCWCKLNNDCCDFFYAEMTRTGVLLTITKEEVEDWHNVKQTTPVSCFLHKRKAMCNFLDYMMITSEDPLQKVFGNNNTVCPAESNIAPPFKGPEKQETTNNCTKWKLFGWLKGAKLWMFGLW